MSLESAMNPTLPSPAHPSWPARRRLLSFPLFCLALWLGAAASVLAAASDRATAWQRWEQSLTSERDYPNAYCDVTLRVTFNGPKGKSFTGYGFWDGGKTFKIRAAFPVPGEWTWKTSCPETADKGLHERSGRVTVAAYSGANTLYQHGFLKISDNHRYLTYADGTPFLWLGDTPWSAFYQATPKDWEAFLDHRAARKFSVQQIHAAAGWTKKKKPATGDDLAPFTGTGATLQANPAYWQSVERKVQAANERGMVAFICAMREPPVNFGGVTRENLDEIRRFARQLAARLAGDFVVWSPIADDVWSPDAEASGVALKDANARQLVIAHPRFQLEPGVTFHDKPYTDAGGLQPGAGWQANPYLKEPGKPFSAELASRWAIEWPLELYRRTPTKPVLNLEGPYDGGNLHNALPRYYAQPYPLRMPRSSGYLAFLSGALGYTYGVGGIWDWGTFTRNASGGWDYPTALNAKSADDMKRFAEFFGSVDWWRLEPHHKLIANQPSDWLHRMVFARSTAGDLAVAYLPDNESITLNLAGCPKPLRAQWFNPATGQREAVAETVAPADGKKFTRPAGWEDAVLLLTPAK